MHVIWTSRNKWTHVEMGFNPAKSMEVIYDTLHSLEMQKEEDHVNPPRPACTWHGPSGEFIKINTDGAIRVDSGTAALGIVAR